jgi:hypothetical protein
MLRNYSYQFFILFRPFLKENLSPSSVLVVSTSALSSRNKKYLSLAFLPQIQQTSSQRKNRQHLWLEAEGSAGMGELL